MTPLKHITINQKLVSYFWFIVSVEDPNKTEDYEEYWTYQHVPKFSN